MLRTLFAAVLSLALAGLAGHAAAAAGAPPIQFQQRTLPNGLKVLTSLDRTTPNVTVQVWYRVGAKNDPAHRSGFAHLFEHMMFKATADFPGEFIDRITEDVGGMDNAFTADDITAYYEVVPSAHLQRLIWLEASRMSSLQVDDASFHSEREVVKEELRQRLFADPYGLFFSSALLEGTFKVHPYRRSALGSIEDLDAASLADVRAFHSTFYRPSNAVLVVVGNFDPATLNAWIDRYLAPLHNPAQPVPQVTAVEPPRTGPTTYVGYGPTVPLPGVALSWLAPTVTDPDAPALKVLDALLTAGKSSRLYDALVYDKQLATQVFSSSDVRQQPGMFFVGAIVANGHTPDEAIAALRAEMDRVRDQPVSAAELEAAKTQLAATELRARETIDGRANELGQAETVEGDASRANTDLDAQLAVTAEDVMRVARKYLPDNLRAEIGYLQQPTAASAAAPAAPGTAPAAEAEPEAPASPPPATAAGPAGPPAGLPPVGAQPEALLPTVVSRTLPNGLRVLVAKSSDLPLVGAQLTMMTGSEADPRDLTGAASLTASLVTQGTATRSARDIARQTETLGAQLSAAAGWEVSTVTLSVMRDKLDAALPIMADVVQHPAFAPEEVERTRKQSLDALTLALSDPQQVAMLAVPPVIYAGTPFAHSTSGDPASLQRLSPADLARFHDAYWRPDNAILVLTGDITPEEGFALAEKVFGGWARPASPTPAPPAAHVDHRPLAVAIDLPGTGQAAVEVVAPGIVRSDPRYFPGLVANSVLGGGYSSRVNLEVRIKRGLSYGADTFLTPRRTIGAFGAEAQTRNETAAQVVALLKGEMSAMGAAPVPPDELTARKSSLIGSYGRNLATAAGLGGAIADLALYGIDPNEIKVYTDRVQAVTADQVQAFSRDVFDPARASVVVAGDGASMLPTLRPALPGLTVVPIAKFNPDLPTLTSP